MSGKPAARVGDKVAGNVIVSGSATVLIGDAGQGCADKACKGSPSVGSPVNPMLGIKVLPGETDFALAAPSPFVFTRSYASDDARIGPLGQGWSVPGVSLYLEISEATTVLVDPQGRRLTFGPLLPGEMRFSPSESLWLRRGGLPEGVDPADAEPWSGRWIGVPATAQREARCIVAMAVGSPSAFIFVERAGRWPLVQVCDRNGYTTSYQWSATGDLRGVQDSAGRLYAYVYQAVCPPTVADRGLRLVGVVLAHDPGRDGPAPATPFDPTAKGLDWLVRFSFDSEGNLVQVRNRMDQPIRYFGWREHILVRHGEPGGIDVRYTYDVYSPRGRVLTQANADGLSYRFDYQLQHTVVTDSLGRVDEYHFEGEGGLRRLVTHVRADGTKVLNEHDAAGRLVAVTDPLGRVTRHRLDGLGRRVGFTRPDGMSCSFRYDDEGDDIVATEDELGRRWLLERDARGRVAAETAPDGAMTRFAYGQAELPDRPTEITDAKGGVQRLKWNRLGQTEQVIDCSGQPTVFAHDHNGHLCGITNALGQSLRIEHDRIGRPIQLSGADGRVRRRTFDALGRQTRVDEGSGRVTQWQHDIAGRVVRLIDPLGHSRAMQYDAAGRLDTLINENGASARFQHDVMDRLVCEIGFDERQRHYRYNAAGELVEVRDADGCVTVHDRDVLGRLVALRVPATEASAAHVLQFTWDAVGQLRSAVSPDVTVHFIHDARGRLTSELQQHADGWTYHHQHVLDALGERASSQYPGLAEVQWLTYGSGHLHGVRLGDLGLDFERDALHRETACRPASGDRGQGWESLRERDETGLLRMQRLTGPLLQPADGAGQDLWWRRYHHDALGQIDEMHDARAGRSRYEHDLAGHLVAFHEGGRGVRRAFDPAGNPLELASSTSVSDNRLLSFGGVSLRHDAVGQVVECRDPGEGGTRLTLRHDGLHRLVEVERHVAGQPVMIANYAYDALGRRVRKQVRQRGGRVTVTRFGWDGDRQSAESQDGQLTTTLYQPGGFIPMLRVEGADPLVHQDQASGLRAMLMAQGLVLPAEPVAKPPEARRISWYLTDHLGTPALLMDLEGQVRWQADPAAWEAVRRESGDVVQPLRYPGQYLDAETGLHYNRYRYYDPALGRYLTQDPIGLAGGWNPYRYVDSPLQAIDPLGLRDIIAAVWERELSSTSVGHVYLGELDGSTISSNFPNPHGMNGANTTKTWAETMQAEGRAPDAVYRINVPDDKGFDASAAREKGRKEWDWKPDDKDQTNCTVSAYRSLKAGGVKLKNEPWIKPYSPNDFLDTMKSTAKVPGSGVTRLPNGVPW